MPPNVTIESNKCRNQEMAGLICIAGTSYWFRHQAAEKRRAEEAFWGAWVDADDVIKAGDYRDCQRHSALDAVMGDLGQERAVMSSCAHPLSPGSSIT